MLDHMPQDKQTFKQRWLMCMMSSKRVKPKIRLSRWQSLLPQMPKESLSTVSVVCNLFTVCPLSLNTSSGSAVSSSPSASINKFEWTGDQDTPKEVERLKMRLQALIGWDQLPPDLELRDVHTQMLFNERVEDEPQQIEITGEH